MSDKVKLNTTPAKITQEGDAWILHFPRFGEEGQHYHSYGLLTPYFKGLTEGKLMATKCTNGGCPIGTGNGEMWLPPRADCPDCHQPMEWVEVEDLEGYIYAYTYVERGGTGLEVECPYYQVDVKLPGVGTIAKSYLVDRKPIKIGDKVRVKFRTGAEATNTSLDMYFELI
jgi:uncharacterized OB-fold protein